MTANNDFTLIELWQKRDELDEPQWELLYRLISQVIKRGFYPQLASLPNSIDDYIAEFISYKVFETAKTERMGGGQLYFANALITYFTRFLISLLRKQKINPTEPINENQAATENKDSELLWQKEIVTKSAKEFLQNSESWVRLYLALHTCANTEQKLPLSKLAARYQIPSYHYKARQLGITRHTNDSLQDYDKTLLGSWLKLLGLSLQQDKQDLEFIFKILCDEALSIIESEL
jgi:hypothetical protein